MKSIVSSLVIAAILVGTGINAAPAAVSDVLDARAVEGVVAPATHTGNSTKPAVHGDSTHPEKKGSSLAGHAAHKQHTLSTSHHHTSTTQHKSKKDKKRRTKKHRKTQNEEPEKKSKEHATVSHGTSTSHTETSGSRLLNHKSDAQPRAISEAAEPVYARSKESKKAKKSRKLRKLRKAKASVQPETETSQESDNTPTKATREFDEALEARLFGHFKQRMREAKANRLQKAAAKAQAQADAAAIKAGITPHTPSVTSTEHATRDLFEGDLDMRDLLEEELEARDHNKYLQKTKKHRKVIASISDSALDRRDVEDDLAVREYFDEELDARTIGDFFRSLTHKENAKEKAARLQREADLASKKADAAAVEAGVGKREYLEDELEMRGFYDDEDLLVREYFDESELASRDHNLWQTLNAITHTFVPTPPAHAPAAAPADGEPKAREMLDEFDLRDFLEVDELD